MLSAPILATPFTHGLPKAYVSVHDAWDVGVREHTGQLMDAPLSINKEQPQLYTTHINDWCKLQLRLASYRGAWRRCKMS